MDSMRNLWKIRNTLVASGLQLRVCRSVKLRQVTSTETFNQFLGVIPRDFKARLLIWLDREGPFWDDERKHAEEEYFECSGEPVTDTGAAEAAYLQSEAVTSWLFSLIPSNFLIDPLPVNWLDREDGDLCLEIPNGWNLDHAQNCISALEKPFSSWAELLEWANRECDNLILSPMIQSQLPLQFYPYVAQRSKVLLSILDQIIGFKKSNNVSEFEEIRKKWMHGDNARFTPSSDMELRDFNSELTFIHPLTKKRIKCSWHGKIQTPQFRIHYEWPLPAGESRLFVAYIGPKITKK